MKLRLQAYAKINLFLSVGELPSESLLASQPAFHPISTVVQNIDLSDELVLSRKKSGIEVYCDRDAPSGEKNIVFKVLQILSNMYDGIDGVSVSIFKKIPVGAGLGGGSSDAAAALKAAIKLFGLSISREDILKIAHKTGSDVPLFIVGGCVHVTGTGEAVRRADSPFRKRHKIVVVAPQFSISTKEAYKAIDKIKRGTMSEISAKSIDLRSCQNDFEQWALDKYKDLVRIKQTAKSCGALSSCLSGSGSAVFSIFEDAKMADNFSNEIKKEKFVRSVFTTKAVSAGMRYLN